MDNDELYRANIARIKAMPDILSHELKGDNARICINFLLKDGEVFCEATREFSNGEKLVITKQKQANLSMALDIVTDMVYEHELNAINNSRPIPTDPT